MTIQAAAVASAQVTVTTTATALDQSTSGPRSLLLRNRGAVAVFLGGSGVTSSTGLQLDPGETLSLDVPKFGAGVYGRTASSTARVDVLQVSLG
jgi:hypothetical protein